MNIFKGWFFYLLVAVAMIIIASFTSNYYSNGKKEQPEGMNIFKNIPSFSFDFKGILPINSSSKVDKEILKENYQKIQSFDNDITPNPSLEEATGIVKKTFDKIITDAPEKIKNSNGFERSLSSYISEKKLFFEKNGFYLADREDGKFNFGFWVLGKQIKLFSLNQ